MKACYLGYIWHKLNKITFLSPCSPTGCMRSGAKYGWGQWSMMHNGKRSRSYEVGSASSDSLWPAQCQWTGWAAARFRCHGNSLCWHVNRDGCHDVCLVSQTLHFLRQQKLQPTTFGINNFYKRTFTMVNKLDSSYINDHRSISWPLVSFSVLSSRINKSTTGYTFTTCVGPFTSPGIDTR